MRRKLKITFLSLGVVLGYGLGIAHIVRHRGYDRHAMRACMHACAESSHRFGPRHHGDDPRGPHRPGHGAPDTSMR
jgi:hypothetical protein